MEWSFVVFPCANIKTNKIEKELLFQNSYQWLLKMSSRLNCKWKSKPFECVWFQLNRSLFLHLLVFYRFFLQFFRFIFSHSFSMCIFGYILHILALMNFNIILQWVMSQSTRVKSVGSTNIFMFPSFISTRRTFN